MATFNPFMQSATAQDIINNYINKPYETPSSINPIFDLREEGQQFPPLNPPVQTTPVVDDPCPPGYQLIDGVCQPIEQFGGNLANEVTGGGDDEVDNRPYMSIEDMENATDEDLLDYLTSGFLKNSPLGFLPSKGTEVTLGMGTLPPLFQLAFGGQNELRKDFILNELMNRGFFTGNFDKNKNPIFDIGTKNINTNVGGIESMLPANNPGDPVTDVYGDTYQQVFNDNQGNTGYTFTSGSDNNYTTGGENSGTIYDPSGSGGTYYGTGRGGTSDNQMTGGGNVIIGGSPFGSDPADDYDDESSGI
jgi:hypothetical protein